MQARSISSIRRSELSQAAFEAVIRYGLRGTTLEKVGEIAGVSKGVVLHHFKDKSALLEAVFRRSNSSSAFSQSGVIANNPARTHIPSIKVPRRFATPDTLFSTRKCLSSCDKLLLIRALFAACTL